VADFLLVPVGLEPTMNEPYLPTLIAGGVAVLALVVLIMIIVRGTRRKR
jgi:hypothetical protein